MLKILNCKIFIIFWVAYSVCARAEEPKLKYEFWKNENGIKVQTCLYGHNSKKILWLLPNLIERNNYHKSLEIVTDIREKIIPKYDYIETSYKGNKTCISYTLERDKGWYNQSFQDISEDSFLLLGNHSLVIPESVFKNHKNINVEFNWNNFPKQIDSNLNKAFFKKQISLNLQDFDSLYYASGYKTLYIDSEKKNKFIYPQNHTALMEKMKSKFIIINTYLEKYLPSNNINKNTFIFVENQFRMDVYPGSAYSNGKEFLQLVGINKEQILDKEFIRTFVHEYLHRLIGYTIKFKPEKSDKEFWFKEGFVDYLSAKILLDTKIWDIEDYMNFYNSRIYKYFALGMNKYMLHDMHSKYIYDEAGYIAGMLYASKLDNFIVLNTNGNKDLLCFLRGFLSCFSQDENLYFSGNLFFKSLKSFVKVSFPSIEELRKKNNLLSEELLSGKLHLKQKKMPVPQYSYNFYELISVMKYNNKQVITMIPESNEPYIYHLKLIDGNDKVEHIVLKPFYKTTFIPQYELTYKLD